MRTNRIRNGSAEMVVWAHDPESRAAIGRSRGIRVREPSMDAVRSGNVFVLTTLSQLSTVTGFVRAANQRHRLKALLIREDVDTKLLPQLMDRADLRTLRNTLVHSGTDVPRRIIGAWRGGVHDRLIATAHPVGDRLAVITCALEMLEVPFDAIPAMERVPAEERAEFEIASEGSYLHWPGADVHLDLDAFRCAIDPELRARRETERLTYDRRFGEAVATVRKGRGLRQSDIDGLSARQVRRIERGAGPTLNALEVLAASHGLPLDDYLGEVAAAALRLTDDQHCAPSTRG